MKHFYVGVDLGQARDYTAVAVLEEQLWCAPNKTDYWGLYRILIPDRIELSGAAGWISPTELRPKDAHNLMWVAHNYPKLRGPHNPPLHIRHLERFELGTPFPEMVSSIKRLLLRDPVRRYLDKTVLLVDRTGLGAPVIDALWQERLRPIGIHFKGLGDVTVRPDNGFNVPVSDLVGSAQVLAQARPPRLKAAARMTLWPTLMRELSNFRVKTNKKTGHETYEHWREGDHDDLVYAVAMATWFRHYINRGVEGYAA
jgi:hypothetical protein